MGVESYGASRIGGSYFLMKLKWSVSRFIFLKVSLMRFLKFLFFEQYKLFIVSHLERVKCNTKSKQFIITMP